MSDFKSSIKNLLMAVKSSKLANNQRPSNQKVDRSPSRSPPSATEPNSSILRAAADARNAATISNLKQATVTHAMDKASKKNLDK